jgi:hypothetical protein
VNDQLSLRRLSLLLRNDLVRDQRTLLIVSAIVAVIALFGPAGAVYLNYTGAGFYRTVFLIALFSVGTVTTSMAFGDLHGRATSTAFLLLPATALEKTVARLLMSTVVLIAYLLLFTTALSLLVEVLKLTAFGGDNVVFSPFDRVVWSVLPHYLVVQSLFFLGAAWFRRLNYIKTLLALVVIVAGLTAFGVSVTWSVADGGLRVESDSYVDLDWLVGVLYYAYVVALPLFCWFVAWLRVKETQVRHGV